MIKSLISRRKQILEYAYPLIFKERNYAGVVIESAKKAMSDYSKNLLNLEINFEEDRNLSEEELFNKYSKLAERIARASIIFDNFISKND